MTQPPRHYGFAQVPRQVLRGEKYKTGDKELSLIEKGLYSCLKDICGETGECFFSQRNLAAEIGTSASTLTRYIPKLRDKGLIYAEMKSHNSRDNNHKIWHIRIVDIWQENDALYEKQSFVADRNKATNASTSVSNRNETTDNADFVSNRPDFVSNSDKDCFSLTDRIITLSNNNLNEEYRDTNVFDETARQNFVPNGTPPSLSSQDQIALLTTQVAQLTIQLERLSTSLMDNPVSSVQPQVTGATNDPHVSSSTTNVGPKSADASSVYHHRIDDNSVPVASSTGNSADVQQVEQMTSHIAIEATKNASDDSIEPLAIGSSVTEPTLPGLEVPSETKGTISKRKGRGKNKHDMTNEQSSMRLRVKNFCNTFKAIGAEMFDIPDFTVRTPSIKEALYDVIVDLIENNASQEQMRLVFMEFWNEKGKDEKFWWRDPNHLTLNALCKNFGTRLASAKFKAKQEEKKQSSTAQISETDPQKMSLKDRNAYYAARYGKSSSSTPLPSNVVKIPVAVAR